MANSVSPLHTSYVAGHHGPEGKIGVTLEEIEDFAMVQFSAWPNTLARTGTEAARIAGCATAASPGEAVLGKIGTLLRVEPLKWWLVAPAGSLSETPVLAPEDGAILDLLQSRVWIRVGGPKAEVLLNHFLPIDLRAAAFPSGTVASTGFHHVGVTLWRDQTGLNLLLPRSFAVSLWDLLCESALQYGLEVIQPER
ncbi:sarcosine oxidase subunit gamma [Rhodobacteraceae bacterium B1Z28]|uniref:Sarcosine oxidase subunit gamma n=1 Tax=Ruegeria haliotis TaxID=2747601 RepID=A0ABX2PPJ9_9RHOB|nr:sarcosine oxidase subunit gamma [Ruegeria haliotis]NVO56068.1 sarcosine oxidase subunit gamma [Ruegeria haliotis]